MPSSPPASSTSKPSDLHDELGMLTTESMGQLRLDLETLPTLELVQAMNAADAAVPLLVGQFAAVIAEAIDAITARMEQGGRLIYVGAGTPGRLGVLDASECPPTFGTPPSLVLGVLAGGDRAMRTPVEGAEDDPVGGARDLTELAVGPVDSVVGISASGRTPYVLGAVAQAKSVGALTVALACNSPSRLGSMVDIPLEIVVGPEFLAGSTRLKAGTAQKLVLNLISTLTMVRLGKTYGNVMVDVVVTNDKLRARAERTIMSITGVDGERAASVLVACDGSVKLAIMTIVTGLSVVDAQMALSQHHGHLRSALHDR